MRIWFDLDTTQPYTWELVLDAPRERRYTGAGQHCALFPLAIEHIDSIITCYSSVTPFPFPSCNRILTMCQCHVVALRPRADEQGILLRVQCLEQMPEARTSCTHRQTFQLLFRTLMLETQMSFQRLPYCLPAMRKDFPRAQLILLNSNSQSERRISQPIVPPSQWNPDKISIGYPPTWSPTIASTPTRTSRPTQYTYLCVLTYSDEFHLIKA